MKTTEVTPEEHKEQVASEEIQLSPDECDYLIKMRVSERIVWMWNQKKLGREFNDLTRRIIFKGD